jgi:hypothetical protein
MEGFLKANKFRTNLLIKISSEIKNFINSPVLINSVSPKNLYDSYSNIEITINNEFEFEVTQIKENQKVFQISPKTKIENEIPYMEIFKKINKIIISDKKNKTFYDKLDIIYTNNKKNIQESNDILTTTYDTPKKLLNNNNEEEQIHKSIKFLRNYSRKFKLNLNPICKCRLKNVNFIPSKTINFKNEYKIIDNQIIENPSSFYFYGLEREIHCCCFKNKSNIIYDNIFTNKRCKISFNY